MMIHLNLRDGFLIFSRCDYLYRNGEKNPKEEKEIGDGDICIPLPEHVADDKWEMHPQSDRASLKTIVEEIQSRLEEVKMERTL